MLVPKMSDALKPSPADRDGSFSARALNAGRLTAVRDDESPAPKADAVNGSISGLFAPTSKSRPSLLTGSAAAGGGFGMVAGASFDSGVIPVLAKPRSKSRFIEGVDVAASGSGRGSGSVRMCSTGAIWLVSCEPTGSTPKSDRPRPVPIIDAPNAEVDRRRMIRDHAGPRRGSHGERC